jgi:hypothetical protein
MDKDDVNDTILSAGPLPPLPQRRRHTHTRLFIVIGVIAGVVMIIAIATAIAIFVYHRHASSSNPSAPVFVDTTAQLKTEQSIFNVYISQPPWNAKKPVSLDRWMKIRKVILPLNVLNAKDLKTFTNFLIPDVPNITLPDNEGQVRNLLNKMLVVIKNQ